MKDDLNILIIDSDPAIVTRLEEKVNLLGFSRCCTAMPAIPIEQLYALRPDLAILGPSSEMTSCLECIHKE